MIFNSISFFLFFLCFFPLYWWINNRFAYTWRNVFIIIGSYLFYGWWDWRFLGLIVLSSTVDFFLGQQIFRARRQKLRKYLLYMSVIVNIGILAIFKYFNFFAESLQVIFNTIGLSLSTTTLDILLPVGISFYTFQTLSYTIDIYRRQLQPTSDPIAFFAFVAFFPQLVAGPIERASRLLQQFTERKQFDYGWAVGGLRLVLWGLFKKIVIADNFGVLADELLGVEVAISGPVVLVGALCFALQIYADFSGYSDMAIGLSRMLGIELMRNFQTPYFADSFRTFWHRWHISLSTWFRDYVYIPLGGNRGSELRVNTNILLTFLLSGLWHGAQITFVIWGGLHGLLLIIENRIKVKLPKQVSTLLVFILVVILWIPFRAENTKHLLQLFEAILDFKNYTVTFLNEVINAFPIKRFINLLIVLILFLLLERKMQLSDFNEWITKKRKWVRWSIYYGLLLLILFLGNFSVKPQFIYFQF